MLCRLSNTDGLSRIRRHPRVEGHHLGIGGSSRADHIGIGYTYADGATAKLINDMLAEVVEWSRCDGDFGELVGDDSSDPQSGSSGNRIDGYSSGRQCYVGS